MTDHQKELITGPLMSHLKRNVGKNDYDSCVLTNLGNNIQVLYKGNLLGYIMTDSKPSVWKNKGLKK